MSENDSRQSSARGRGSIRGGRGGLSRGGARGGRKPSHGTANAPSAIDEIIDNDSELAETKKKYIAELGMLKDMFPDWTDVDLLLALEESHGDLTSTVDKITQGNVSQFAEVKKSKDRARSKVKEETPVAGADKTSVRATRGRGGYESVRGGRGRATERGRGGARGGRGGHATTNGSTNETLYVPADSSTNEAAKSTLPGPAEEQNASLATESVDRAKTEAIAAPPAQTTNATESVPKKSWASMFSQPKPAPVIPLPKPVTTVVPPPIEAPQAEPVAPIPPSLNVEEAAESGTHLDIPTAPVSEVSSVSGIVNEKDVGEADIPPSKVPLTEENVEHLPDDSNPPPTQTVLSTAGSMDTRLATPLPSQQQTPIGRPPVGGFATSAYRATGLPTRSASFQRRVQEQQEAVVMPGHNAVDRASVQFGSMGLGGEQGLDVDEDREDPETRQAPQDSPPSQPRTSLPPRQAAEAQAGHETTVGAKQAPGLPPASAHNQQQVQDAMSASAIAAHEQGALNTNYGQYARYGAPQDGLSQKPYDAFSHQAQHGHYDQYASQGQHQGQQQSHAGFGGLSAAQDYSSYYSSDPSRNAYSQYYGGSYGQQDSRGPFAQAQQDASVTQRSGSGFGASQHDSAYGQHQHHAASQGRYNDAPGSGHNTPGPLAGANQSASQGGHSQQAGGQQQQPAVNAAGFPYGHPYYNSPYQVAYQNQFGYNGAPAGYGSGYPGKQGNYGVPQGYGQASYDQQQTSAAGGGYGQNQSARSASNLNPGLGNSLEDYSRPSAIGGQQQGGSYGAGNDPFARSTSGFGAQSGYGQQAPQEDSLKAYNDSKNGTSPAPGRPGSAANSAVGSTTQGGLPAPQSQQGSYGGYQGFPSQGNQYGGFGGLTSQQQQQSQQSQQQGQQNNLGNQGGYGSYGASGFGGGYGSTYGRSGGWGSNYGGTH